MNGLVVQAIALLIAQSAAGTDRPAAAPPGSKLTLEQTMGPKRVSFGAQPPNVAFAPDRVRVELQRDGKAVWFDPRTGKFGEPEPAKAPAEKPTLTSEEIAAALQKLGGFDEATAKATAGRRVASDPDRCCAIVLHEGDLWFVRDGREQAVRLTTTPAAEELVRLAPDGRFASFVRGNDLFVVATDDARERALTKDGGPERLNGKLDWVYQEEVYGRGNFHATWWSPDSSRVAFLSLDESGVPHVPIVDAIPDHFELEDTRYPKAGDPNPKATLGVARASDGKVTWVDLSRFAGSEPLVVRVGWTPAAMQPMRVVFQVQDREQTWLELLAADPDNGSVTPLLRETGPAWVNVLEEPRWLDDGSYLWLSERDGYKHLYLYPPPPISGGAGAAGAAGPIARLTSGEWEVRDVVEVDAAKQRVWFTASKDSAIGANLYRVGFDGGGLVRLTQGGGSHSVEAGEGFAWFLDRVSSVAFPPEVRLCDGEDGRVVEVLGKAEVKAIAEYGYCAPELLQIPARDGFLMDATLIAPAERDPAKPAAIWLPTYSGPDSPSVGDRWNGDPWAQFLAQQGYAVLQVNNRTSSQRGLAHVAKCYQQFGRQELADLEDAVAWVGKNRPWADASRVAISGWSYGGFMAAYALTHSTAFKLGVAGAGVYDWKLYDSIYTERYMRTPANNPDGYAQSSCIGAADQLSGHLVLAHGTQDDNVHFQNTVQFALALQKAGKDFDLMIYPRSRHGLGSPEQQWHFRRLTWNAIRERL